MPLMNFVEEPMLMDGKETCCENREGTPDVSDFLFSEVIKMVASFACSAL